MEHNQDVAKENSACFTLQATTADGTLVGVVVVDARDTLARLGPIAVHTGGQGKGVGRALMHAAVQRAREYAPAVALCQMAFNTTSLPLYNSIGFDVVEHLVAVSGLPPATLAPPPHIRVTRATLADVDACDGLHARAVRDRHQPDFGVSRRADIEERVKSDDATQVLCAWQDERMVGYCAAVNEVTGHLVAESTEIAQALLLTAAAAFRAAANERQIAIHVSARTCPALFRWALGEARLRVERQLAWMCTRPGIALSDGLVFCGSISG